MKKYFSLTMLLAMVLTLVSTVPAQAALDATYPYIFLDYNQQVATKGAGTAPFIAKSEWAENEGVGGTGALKVTDRNHSLNDDSLSVSTLLDKESITGGSYKISGWVKFVSANKLNSDGTTIDGNLDGNPDQWELIDDLRFGTVLEYGYKNNGVDTLYRSARINVKTPGLSDHRWHYFEQEYVQVANPGAPYEKAFCFTDDGRNYPYDWTTGINTNFSLRFLSNASSDSRFYKVFKDSTTSDCNGELIYYLDDFQYIPVVSDTVTDGSVPIVALTSPATLVSNLVDETVNISWNHTPSNAATSSKVVVRVFKQIVAGTDYATNGWVLVDQQYANGNSFNYPLTVDMLGDTYKFEVFPYDVTSNSYRAGAIKTVTMTRPVSNPVTVEPKAGTPITFTSLGAGNGGTVTFELAEVTNNKSATTLDLFTIIALYDTNGALIDCKINNLPDIVGVGSLPSSSLTHTVTLSTDAEYNEVASAKAFVWSGSNFNDALSHISYTSVQSKTK